MFIESLQIVNYKSFRLSQELKFTPGFNVIVGENNVGKTALLEALSLSFTDRPHFSLLTLPEPGSPYEQASESRISFGLLPGEVMKLIRRFCNLNIKVFLPIDSQDIPERALDRFISASAASTRLISVFKQTGFTSAYLETYAVSHSERTASIDLDKVTGMYSTSGITINVLFAQTYGALVANHFRSKIYAFKAERLRIDACALGTNSVLATDASNLPEVLNLLQTGNPERFKRFIQLVTTVFPQVKYITIPASAVGHVRIMVWTHDPSTERLDLAMPLSESGTGLGQVLAILYVVVNSDEPKTIIIDEPQSFLHPGAVRKLFAILKLPEYLKHQFVITTHSPIAVTATNPKTLLLIRKNEFESYVDEIDVSDNQEMELFLSEVGARLSDVFGADNILWVEGPTEERCFPLLLERIAKRSLLGTKIVGVLHTGDFEGKHSKTVFEIYKKLTQGQGLLPPAIGFIFDREERSEQDRKDLERQSGGKFSWLPRKMYENYLLNPSAISDVLSASDPSGETKLTAEDVTQWLHDHGSDRKYIRSTSTTPSDTQWLVDVDGAKVLADLFNHLSDSRVSFDKVKHGVALTEWIIEHDPRSFSEVVTLIETALDSSQAQS